MYSLMPTPTEVKPGEGEMLINMNFRISMTGCIEPRLERAVVRLMERLAKITGNIMQQELVTSKDDVQLLIHIDEKVAEVQSAVEDESYSLDINTESAVLKSTTIYGAFRGIETFIQLVKPVDNGFSVPVLRIKDAPRFPWRGLLIDASRHWIPVTVIKRNLEAMASVKLNVLHWHLTNDQGFRIESKRYPKLHELGSDGLFYSQEDVKEIVRFARDRGIRILPEFDMPGHTSSWFVGYPDLASAPGPYQIERKWGGFGATMDPTKEETYMFISNFFSEMATLFPDAYVHIGGDQVNGKQWQSNSNIREFMEKEAIKDVHHLQTYFNNRLHDILHTLGKVLVGWDPILDTELHPRSIIQSVRGQKWLAEAVTNGFRAVAGSEYYLDMLLPAASYYESDPFAAETKELTSEQQKLIIGGEASMWTEFADAENIDLRIWPRAAAIAERLWSPQEIRDVDDMYRRLSIVSQRLNRIGLKHESGRQEMLDHLVGDGSVERLNILAETLRPDFNTRWNNHEYTSATPLNRLVDAIGPDSENVRIFSKYVDKFILDTSDVVLHDRLLAQLQTWQSNHLGLVLDIQKSSLMTELQPLSEMLSQVAEIGIKLVTALTYTDTMVQSNWEKEEALLRQASEPIAELVITIVPDIQKLSKVLYKER
jgi:hexosaminidase